MVFGLTANSQPVKSHRYIFGSDLRETSVSVTGNSLTINYSISEIDLENITNEHGTFYKLAIPGHIKSTESGKPEMPVLSRLIMLPEEGSYTIKITEVKTTRIRPKRKNIEGMMFPAQVEETKKVQKQKPGFVIDKALYATRGYLKTDTVRIEHAGKARGVNLATLMISPVRYNPRSNILEIITSMKIEIIFTGKGIKTLPAKSSLFDETLGKGILNYKNGDVIPGYTDKPVRMIILTDTSFKKYLEPFIRWKTQKGIKIEILYRGSDLAGNTYTELRDTIKSIYLNSSAENPPPEYLLIIGNTAKIPYYGTGQVTDMYYGEFDGDGDYLPEMFIGRLPVADTNELKAVTEKIIQYEKFEFADTNLFHSNAIATAGYDAGYANYMNGQVFYAIDNYLNEENNVNEYHFYYTQATDKDDSIKVRRDSIINLIDKGISFINYTGHGSSTGWLKLAINNATIDTLENQNMYPFIISNACETSSFNLSNSFGTRWVTSDKKGAIGFIGASNDTYWSEDYFWAVGLGTPSADPTYETTGLGAIDRFFHTHEESPSDWYITMGQVNYAGNLAVSASASSILIKKYYWEIYNLVGDPSVIPIIGTPDTFNIILPDTLPNNMRSWSFTGEPFSYMAISHADTLCDASYFSPSGNVTLDLPGISDDSCLVVITGQNRIPLIETIKFSTIADEYVNLTATAIDDSTENNNGMADFGETFSINLIISNLGSTNAENLYAKISSGSEYITINTDSVMIGTLDAGSDIMLNDDLSVTIAENVPDMETILFEILLRDDAGAKTYEYYISAHAPDFDVLNFLIDDITTGNGNNIAEQGETVTLIFMIRNNGTSSTSGQFYITSFDPFIDIPDYPPVKSEVLGFGESTSIPVSVKISESVETGAVIYFTAIFDCQPYIVSKQFSFRVGQIRESFEYESFRIFPWLNISNIPWTITETDDAYDGIAAARSGEIDHNASSILSIKAYYSAEDSLKFYYKVSSEADCDFFIFKLNGKEILKKSGETGWEKIVVPIPLGYNAMEWIYRKDVSVIEGSDCAMIDMIDFSESGTVRFVRKDLAAAKLISPVQKDKIGREKVVLKVLNEGPDTIKGFNMAYRINYDPPVKEHFDNTLVPLGDSVNVSFTLPIDFSRYGIYNIEIYGYDNNDDYPFNDTLRTEIEHTTIIEPFLVFPNPFTDELNIFINSDVAGTVHFALYNTSGKKNIDVEYEIAGGMNEIKINASHLPASLYFLRIEYPGITRTVKVVKTRK
jgi:hypothetical protein